VSVEEVEMAHVYIWSRHRVITHALASLLVDGGHEPHETTDPRPACAVVDLCHETPPLPGPPVDVPTIALVCLQRRDLPTLLRLGYRGYLRPDALGPHVLRAIDAVLAGEVWAERKVVGAALLEEAAQTHLTPREIEVLEVLGSGSSNHEIAAALGITVKTVKSHVSQLYSKLDIQDRVKLSLRAQSLPSGQGKLHLPDDH
jgi:DNA-binding CsgD family transcriptional regulator